MPQTCFESQTLDDLLRDILQHILEEGNKSRASRGPFREIIGVQAEIANPLARLSRTETRSKFFSSLGELCWYLSGSSDLEFIKYYIPNYENFADEYGAYGPRLRHSNGENQINNVISLLTKRPTSRRAVIQLFEPRDIAQRRFNVPCTCTLQYLVRESKLHAITYMRSNDAYIGLPHDVFCFTMLQEILARTLGVQLGTYMHMVGSLHLYDEHTEEAKKYIDEGLQPTNRYMNRMPQGTPWPSIGRLLRLEQKLRQEQLLEPDKSDFNSYWKSLATLLQIHSLRKHKKWSSISELLDTVSDSGLSHMIRDLKSEASQFLAVEDS